jgi:putative DNA primase/helicase
MRTGTVAGHKLDRPLGCWIFRLTPVFDNAGPENDAARLSDAIKKASRTWYGTAGPAFVRRLAAEESKQAARHITAAV